MTYFLGTFIHTFDCTSIAESRRRNPYNRTMQEIVNTSSGSHLLVPVHSRNLAAIDDDCHARSQAAPLASS